MSPAQQTKQTQTRQTKPAAAKKASRKLPTTIGDNPLDLLLPAAPVKNVAMTRKQRPPSAGSDGPGREPTTVLTITVPRSLAQQVENILAVSPELSFDQIMSTSLAEVLASIRGRNRGRVRSGTSVKDLASSVKRKR